MKKDMNDLKKLVLDMLQDGSQSADVQAENAQLIRKLYQTEDGAYIPDQPLVNKVTIDHPVEKEPHIEDTEEYVEESLSLEAKEIELIKKALEKHRGKRKYAAQELGISERTLYRKIKEHNIDQR